MESILQEKSLKNKVRIVILLLCCLVLMSCESKTCVNDNPVFEQNQVETEVYMKELVKEISIHNDCRYWFNTYLEKRARYFMLVDIRGDSFCTKAIVNITGVNRFKELIKSEGKGYKGAELVGLTFDTTRYNKKLEFKFKSLDYIQD